MLGLYRDKSADFTVKHFHERLTQRRNDPLGDTVTKLVLHRAGHAESPSARRTARNGRGGRRPRTGRLGLRPRRQGDVARDPAPRRGAHGRLRQRRGLERKAPATAGEPPHARISSRRRSRSTNIPTEAARSSLARAGSPTTTLRALPSSRLRRSLAPCSGPSRTSPVGRA